MYWYGVKHGRVRARNYHGVKHQRFINGLRDERGALIGTEGVTQTPGMIAQGVQVERDHGGHTKEEELRGRFGSELSFEENSFYTLSSAQDLSPEQQAIPQISGYINTTDDGMRAYTMSLRDGSSAQVVLWSQGDTTLGVILNGSEVLGEIQDLEIRLPSTVNTDHSSSS